MDGIQLQISAADANSSEALLAEQKTLSASGKETQGLYAVAVIIFAEAEKKESAVALEVVKPPAFHTTISQSEFTTH